MKRILHDEQNVYIEGERLRGVQSCQASWIHTESYINAVGYEGGYVGSVTDGPLVGEFSVDRLMVSSYDPVINYFSRENLMGQVASRDNNFSFNGGMLNSYSCSCSIGEIPSLNFGITAYQNTGGSAGALKKEKEKDETFIIAAPGSIVLNVEGYATNAIQSFDLSISIDRQPFQVIGQSQPVHYTIQYPIEVDCQFEMIVNDYEASNVFDAICSPVAQDLYFIFKECRSNEEIRKFRIPNAKLIEYNQNSENNAPLQATLTYKYLCNNINNVKKILLGDGF